MEDVQIIDLYWNRIETAIAETYTKYGGYCNRIAYNILGNSEDSDECVNDTFLHTWDSIPPNRPNILSAYLGKITRNIALNQYKRANAAKRGGGTVPLLLQELEECIPNSCSVEEEYEAGVTAKVINNYLRCIDTENRVVFVRRYWYADSISVISKRYHISESKVKSMLFRSRKKLKDYLEKEGIQI